MLRELGLSTSSMVVLLVIGYFVIKWAVRNGIAEAYTKITGKETAEDKEARHILGIENESEM